MLAYQAKMVELAGIIIRTLVRGLPEEWGCPPDALDGLMDDPAIPMRMLHYGPVKEQDSRQFGGMSCPSQNRLLTMGSFCHYQPASY